MVSYVGPHFFSTMSIPIVTGRGFTEQDTESSTPVAIVNQTLVRWFYCINSKTDDQYTSSGVTDHGLISTGCGHNS